MANTSCCGQADANAIFTRRTLTVISAPIFNSFNRMVPQVALARSVPPRPMRRSAAITTLGERCKLQPRLIGAQGGCTGAARKQVGLAFLDAVFHFSALAVDVLVELAGVAVGPVQRGDEEAPVGPALGPLGLGNDAARPRPALAGVPVAQLGITGVPAGPTGDGLHTPARANGGSP